MTNPTSNFGWQMPTATDLVTDLPADFAVFGQAVDTTMAGLKGGTTGQILSKTSATDMAFTWITNDVGDITAVNTTAPLQGGATSGAVTLSVSTATTASTGVVQLSDSTSTTSSVLAATPTAVKSAYDLASTASTTATAAIPKSTVTTAGDLIVATGSSAVTRLGIGTNGQILQSNGSTAVWGSPSGSMTVLASGSLSGQSVTVSSISGSYKDLIVLIRGAQISLNADVPCIRLNGASTNYYSFGNGMTNNTVANNATQATNTAYFLGNVGSGWSNASTVQTAMIEILDYTNTTSNRMMRHVAAFGSNTATIEMGAGVYRSTSAVTSLEIRAATGTTTWTSGTYIVYGVN